MISLEARTIGLGAISGLRSMMGPALLCYYLNREPEPSWKRRLIKLPKLQTVTAVLAGGELVGDKLPNAPDRISPIALAGRAISGALIGAILYKEARRSTRTGAIMGAVSAVVSAGVGFYLRKKVGQTTDVQDPIIGGAEDLLALGAGSLLVTH
ncbi:DUF4126 family protein [Fulvivirga ligni]|uniref:DUF4126 family protein n=1 Tax=Fulvivirga ligni TaxID=2904246 RepID=UPI001F191A44|nr:DUF4126 family protein [Fulvivirga ligni]UII23604.1 DUF4126 family protein [Fulvivirga ligni]